MSKKTKASLLALMAAAVAVAGCGGGGSTETLEELVESHPAPMSSEQRKAYGVAEQVCEGLGAVAVAKTYGGDDAAQAAVTYSSKVFSGAAETAAREGCLAGFSNRNGGP